MSKAKPDAAAAADTAAPVAATVHTSALPTKPGKPAHHKPSVLPPPDEFSGKGGRYVRDPVTGLRTRQEA